MTDDRAVPETARTHRSQLADDLAAVLNRYSCENESNTPDFILAKFLLGCLQSWDNATRNRERWYGRDPNQFTATAPSPAFDSVTERLLDAPAPRPEPQEAKQPNPCPKCGTFLWDDTRPCCEHEPLERPPLPAMIDIPLAWQLTRATDPEQHHEKCSYRTAKMLCDCAAFHVMQQVSRWLKSPAEAAPSAPPPQARCAECGMILFSKPYCLACGQPVAATPASASAPPPFTADKFTPARAAFLAKELRTTGCFELADMANCLASPLAEIATERKRQKAVEGWTEAHDDGHRDRELAYAAACYAIALGDKDSEPRLWPWQRSWWKPKDQRSNLIRAAALLLAEIERLDRATLLPPGGTK